MFLLAWYAEWEVGGRVLVLGVAAERWAGWGRKMQELFARGSRARTCVCARAQNEVCVCVCACVCARVCAPWLHRPGQGLMCVLDVHREAQVQNGTLKTKLPLIAALACRVCRV
jgi:hypothetical protein